MLDTLSFQPSLDFTDGVRSLHARLAAQTGAWLCRSSLQGATLRRRRFAPATRLDRPSVVFNCGF